MNNKQIINNAAKNQKVINIKQQNKEQKQKNALLSNDLIISDIELLKLPQIAIHKRKNGQRSRNVKKIKFSNKSNGNEYDEDSYADEEEESDDEEEGEEELFNWFNPKTYSRYIGFKVTQDGICVNNE